MDIVLKFLSVTVYSSIILAGAQSECPDSWIPFQKSCYLFGTEHEEFVVAEEFCRHKDAHLVHINDATENAFITSWLGRLKPENWWMGLTDRLVEGVWMWEDTKTFTNFSDWYPGQPNNYQDHENCAHFFKDLNWKWNDFDCTDKCNPICEISRPVDCNAIVG